MARLSKQQSKAHNQALELVALERDLTEDIYTDAWRGVSPKVEVAVCDFAERAVRAEKPPAPVVSPAPSRKPRPVTTLNLPGDAEPSAPRAETLFDFLDEAS